METNDNDLLIFRKFSIEEQTSATEACLDSAMDKLQTLYPGKRITAYDEHTLGIETDSLYSDSGIDIYELGMVDDELFAMRNTRSGEVITFR